VKVGDFEVDTTQMSQKEFTRFLATLQKHEKKLPKVEPKDRHRLWNEFEQQLIEEGFKVVQTYSSEDISEKRSIKRAVSTALHKARNRYED